MFITFIMVNRLIYWKRLFDPSSTQSISPQFERRSWASVRKYASLTWPFNDKDISWPRLFLDHTKQANKGVDHTSVPFKHQEYQDKCQESTIDSSPNMKISLDRVNPGLITLCLLMSASPKTVICPFIHGTPEFENYGFDNSGTILIIRSRMGNKTHLSHLNDQLENGSQEWSINNRSIIDPQTWSYTMACPKIVYRRIPWLGHVLSCLSYLVFVTIVIFLGMVIVQVINRSTMCWVMSLG